MAHDHLGLWPNISSTFQCSQEGSIREDFLQEEAFFWDFQMVLWWQLGRGDLSPLNNGGDRATTLDDCLLGDSGQVLVWTERGLVSRWHQAGRRQKHGSPLRSAG